MANPSDEVQQYDEVALAVRLARFSISGLFGYLAHTIPFPAMNQNASEPEILIVEGQNGTGKTTIMRMIAGAIKLDFDEFRRVPFESASLELSNGDVLTIRRDTSETPYPLVISFRDKEVSLARNKDTTPYAAEHRERVDELRAEALPILRTIDYDLLEIDRAPAIETKSDESMYYDVATGRMRRPERKSLLANRVRDFLRDAQVNYRRFFQAEDLELLPRILDRFALKEYRIDPAVLLDRIGSVQHKNGVIRSFGLQTDDADLEALATLTQNPVHSSDSHALSLIESYVEMHEKISKSRELITQRLVAFEEVLDEFLVGKKVKVSAREGFVITTATGKLKETDLSSGEFHFMYMMVAALLCQRIGTIIAIDEPELSLHVSWQRKLVRALSKCASGASPLFFLSTHSTSISAEHADKVVTLSAID